MAERPVGNLPKKLSRRAMQQRDEEVPVVSY
jgi:hypothetical protein